MAGMEFEYDEEGGTFYFFLMSFMALVLLPATYLLWNSGEVKDEDAGKSSQCTCDSCVHKKLKLKASKPNLRLRGYMIKAGLLLGWLLFALVSYKASQVKLDFTEFDPYGELNIDRGATGKEIKKAYHKLSVIFHPDKDTGDELKFMKITKAYKALTNEESRKNWEEYGNPDGPGATQFGIALPKWIVEKQNSIWVLGLYALVFMIALPCAVGTWWYRSIKYSADQILMDTTQLYFIFYHKTPNMIVKRILMVLGASFEYNKAYNQEVIERPTDNEQIPRLMKSLPYLNEKNKERPLNYIYSIKARSLIHAHLTRLELPPSTLDHDKDYILEKSLFLVNEMVNIVSQLVSMSHAGRVNKQPRLTTVENIIKVGQMLVQARWEGRSALLQLPHISEDILRHFTTRKRNVRTIQQLVTLPYDERRAIMRALSDQEYNNVMNVCANLPMVTMQTDHGVIDEEDKSITAGSIVTVSVFLTRTPMSAIINDSVEADTTTSTTVAAGDGDADDVNLEDNDDQYSANNFEESPAAITKPKSWEKQSKKKQTKNKNKNQKKVKPVKKLLVPATPTSTSGGAGDVKSTGDEAATESESDQVSVQGDETSGTESDCPVPAGSDSPGGNTVAINRKNRGEQKKGDTDQELEEEDDDDDWMKFQAEANKQNSLETKSKETHIVHCPFFPMVKFEYWWLYVADKKNQELISAPIQVTSLRNTEEVQLKFTAPLKTGRYVYTVNLRSDSYFDFDQTQTIRFEVSEHKEVDDHPQWQISDDEDEDNSEEDDISYGTGDSASDTDYSDSD